MAKLKYHPDLSNITTLEMFIKYGTQAINQLQDIIDGAVTFDDNILSQTLSIKFSVANQEQLITHSLNRKGLRFIVVDKSVTCDVFHNAGRDNVSQICLSCTVATTVTIILI